MDFQNIFIPTYFLDNESIEIDKRVYDLFPEFKIEFVSFSRHSNELSRFKKIIEAAKRHEDDAILIIKNLKFVKSYKTKTFFNSIFASASSGFHAILMGAHIDAQILSFRENLLQITKAIDVSACVLLKSAYDFILSIIERLLYDKHECKFETALNFYHLKKVIPIDFAADSERLTKKKVIQYTTTRDKFRINLIIPFRNIDRYIKMCIDSILSQNHKNVRVFFINDHSTDNSVNLIPNHPYFQVSSTPTRKFALYNIHDALCSNDFNDDDIIAILDGDDALLHENSLQIINNIYVNNKTCLMTYGTFSTNYNCEPDGMFSYTRTEFENLRISPWKASHLKTFKFAVYREFLRQDPDILAFKDKEGAIYKMTYDMALMFPLMEIAGFKNVIFNEYPIYFYRVHEQNDHFINRKLQLEIENEIRSKPSFKK